MSFLFQILIQALQKWGSSDNSLMTIRQCLENQKNEVFEKEKTTDRFFTLSFYKPWRTLKKM